MTASSLSPGHNVPFSVQRDCDLIALLFSALFTGMLYLTDSQQYFSTLMLLTIWVGLVFVVGLFCAL